jgi:hypothetical protein
MSLKNPVTPPGIDPANPQGVLIHFVSRVNRMRVQIKYLIKELRAVCVTWQLSTATLILNLIFKSAQAFC